MTTKHEFVTISGDDWARSLAIARARENAVLLAIKKAANNDVGRRIRTEFVYRSGKAIHASEVTFADLCAVETYVPQTFDSRLLSDACKKAADGSIPVIIDHLKI
jgi:hypothetical protein